MTETSALALGMRRVLVTGATSGIGRATALRLLELGSQVVVSGRRQEVLAELAAQFPGQALPCPCDLANPDEQADLLGRAAQLFGGKLDGVVHSAGIANHAALPDVDDASFAAHLELHLLAPFRMCKAALETLDPGGAMVVVGSTLSARPIRISGAYSAAKAGALALLKVAALEGAERGIRFNTLSPGLVDTPMLQTARRGTTPEPGELEALHPLGRLGRPEEIADAIVYLLGAPWVTGTELVIDGGLLVRE